MMRAMLSTSPSRVTDSISFKYQASVQSPLMPVSVQTALSPGRSRFSYSPSNVGIPVRHRKKQSFLSGVGLGCLALWLILARLISDMLLAMRSVSSASLGERVSAWCRQSWGSSRSPMVINKWARCQCRLQCGSASYNQCGINKLSVWSMQSGKGARMDSPQSLGNVGSWPNLHSAGDGDQGISHKIHRLKNVLRDSERDNHYLHRQLKHLEEEVLVLAQESRKYRIKYENLKQENCCLQHAHDSLTVKYSMLLKQTSHSIKQKQQTIKQQQQKVSQLQRAKISLQTRVHELEQAVSKAKQQLTSQKSEHEVRVNEVARRLEQESNTKAKQVGSAQLQATSLREINRQLSRKLQKAALTLREQADKHAQLQEQAEKQLADLSSTRDQLARQVDEMAEKIRLLEKCTVELQYEKQVQGFKIGEIDKENEKLRGQLGELMNDYGALQNRMEDLLLEEYDTHKDMERDLLAISREIARRDHLASSPAKTIPTFQPRSRKPQLRYKQ